MPLCLQGQPSLTILYFIDVVQTKKIVILVLFLIGVLLEMELYGFVLMYTCTFRFEENRCVQ